MVKKVTDILPLLTIVIIYYAYCNLYYYYSEFNIEIYSYISNSELLMSFLPTIVIITAAIGAYLSSFLIGSATSDKTRIERQNRDLLTTQEKKPIAKKNFFQKKFLPLLYSIISLILIGISYYLFEIKHYKRYELRGYIFVSSFSYPLTVYYVLYSFVKELFWGKYYYWFSFFVILYIAQQIGSYRKLESEEVKNSNSKYKISFVYSHNKIIMTSNNLVYIGQTQSNLFLYQKRDSSTLIFNRSNIDSLIIK